RALRSLAERHEAKNRRRVSGSDLHVLLQLGAMEIFVYGLLMATSVVGLAFIVERGLALRWRRVVPPEIEAAVESCQTAEDVPMLRRVCQQHNASAMSRLLLLAADHLHWPIAENVDAIQTRARHEITRLERGLV